MEKALVPKKKNIIFRIWSKIKRFFAPKGSIIYKIDNSQEPNYIKVIEKRPALLYNYTVGELEVVYSYYKEQIKKKKGQLF